MIYTIKKGSHASNWFPKFTLSNKVYFLFAFETNPSYLLENKQDQKDTNKIFGISDSWYHRRHSIRIGWSYNPKTEKATYCAYYYRDGKHYVETMGELAKGDTHTVYIEVLKDSYTVVTADKVLTIPRTSKWWGPRYFLFPYFGGQQVAPKEFKIKINKW